MATQEPGQSGGMSVREAGRRGGERVKAKYGSEFYEEIGRKGGEATKTQVRPVVLRSDRAKRRSAAETQGGFVFIASVLTRDFVRTDG